VCKKVVAQIFNLPYRGFAIRNTVVFLKRLELLNACRVQLGDTAD
jgi:hypothetical protein